ncbi:MAG: c-type cytochrome [Aestuariivirga sp.]
MFIAAMAVAMALLIAVLLNAAPGIDPRTLVQGREIYLARCAQCHGKNLEGQKDWKTPLASGRLPAPPHDVTGHTWHHADSVLVGVTRHGLKPYAGENYESDMPAFDGILTDAEIDAIWAYVKSTWPDRQRQYQEQITRQAGATTK